MSEQSIGGLSESRCNGIAVLPSGSPVIPETEVGGHAGLSVNAVIGHFVEQLPAVTYRFNP